MSWRLFVGLFFSCLSLGVDASNTRLRLPGGAHVAVELPHGWLGFTNTFGIPLQILSPEGPVKRAVVSLSFARTQGGTSFDDVALKKRQSEYEEGRRLWLAKRGGRVLRFMPFRSMKFSSGVAVRRIGYQYQLDGQDFEEEMLLSTCQENIVFVNTLLPLVLRAERGPEMETLLESLNCR
jgi:hypothetical protein